jgi:hypothetical protein
MNKAKRQKRAFFHITGFRPKSDRALVGYARSNREIGCRLTQLFEQHPEVAYDEVLRFRTWTDTEQKIRDDVGVDRKIKPVRPRRMTLEGEQTLQ